MGLSGETVNNWNPWICSNWLVSALLMERDALRLRSAAYKILQCLDNFLNGYAEDGGCDEGPSYWGRAGASLFDCLDLLHERPAAPSICSTPRWYGKSDATSTGRTFTMNGIRTSRMRPPACR